jgi:hypothetical protein
MDMYSIMHQLRLFYRAWRTLDARTKAVLLLLLHLIRRWYELEVYK